MKQAPRQKIMVLRSVVIVILISLSAHPLYAQRWTAALNTQQDMDAIQFYSRQLKDFREKTREEPYRRFWPEGGELAQFALQSESPFQTPHILGYFMPNENRVYLLADTATVLEVIRTSMADPNERELQILFEAVIIVHEFSVHWNQYNHTTTEEEKEFGRKFRAALDNRRLTDSLVVRFLIKQVRSEHEAYVGLLEYLYLHYQSGEFSQENYLKAIENANSGFQNQFQDPSSSKSRFVATLIRRATEYQALDRRTPEQDFIIQGHTAFMNAGNETVREIDSFREKVVGNN